MADPDDALRALYRGLPRDEPSPEIDAAVLAAGRLRVRKRTHNWRVPVSVAAVLVLSVAVTLRVADEQPEIQATQPPAPQVGAEIASIKPAPKADAPVAGPVLQPPKTQLRSEMPSRAARPEPTRPAKEEASIAAAPAFVPSPQADVAGQRQASAPAATAAPAPAAPTAPAGQSMGQVAQSGARADRRAPMTAKSEASNLASAASLSPEAWLERIIELRASARHKEADESYAEFRRRFPDYVVPPEKLQRIAPPR